MRWRRKKPLCLILAFWIGLASSFAAEEKRLETPPPERTVQFPAPTEQGQSLGSLRIRDWGSAKPFIIGASLGLASGEMTIPAGKELCLSVNQKICDLSPLAKLAPNDLQGLSLWGNPVTDSQMVHVGRLKGLRVLRLSKTQIGDAGLKPIRDLASLKELWLNGTRVSDQGLAYLGDLKSLEKLVLSETEVTDEGLLHLRGLTGLRELILDGTQIVGDGLIHLSRLTNLEHLNLDRTGITNENLVHLKGMTSLIHLRLSDNLITDAGLAHLGRLTSLRYLDLENRLDDKVRITNAGLSQLKRLKSIQTLYLRGNPITDSGLAHLVQVPSLKALNLQSTGVTDSGLAHLGAMSQLWRLSLTGTRITDAGLPHLANLRALRHLNLRNTRTTARGIQALKQKLPDCRIVEADWSKQGMKAPELGLEKLLQAPKGADVSWEALKGKVVILEFWATWCGPCCAAIPHLNGLAASFGDQPLYLISITSEDEAAVLHFLETTSMGGWIGLDTDRSLFEAMGVERIPYTVVVDKTGRMVSVGSSGELTVPFLKNLIEDDSKPQDSDLPQ